MIYDNPAARLLSILEEGKNQSPETHCTKVWNLLLATEDTSLLVSRLGKTMNLTQQTIVAIQEEFPDGGNTWSHWAQQVNYAFMVQDISSKWVTFIKHIDDHTITYLRMSATMLQAKSNTKLIAVAELGALRQTFSDLLVDILAADIPVEIKKYLARQLRNIVDTIDDYRISGALPLLDAVDATVGHMAVDKEYNHFLTKTEIGKRLLDTLGAMANVVTVAVGLPQLPASIALLANLAQ